jgi:ribosomal protein L11 methyltransferase
VTESWLHLTVQAKPENLDAVANFLIERGAPGVVVKGRGLEAYFRHGHGDAALKQAVTRFAKDIANFSPRTAPAHFSWRLVRAENWHDKWRRFIKPRRVGKCFWVTPPWLSAPKFRSRQIITIEPGLAFGTGTHATTRGCMEFIERVAAALKRGRFTALDVGTGSGILAIAMVKLGAQQVWAIDHDPVALTVAEENFRSNGVFEKVCLSDAKLSAMGKKFSVVVANLTAETISELSPALKRKVAPAGFLILAGILLRQANAVARHFKDQFWIVSRKRSGEWITLLLRKKERPLVGEGCGVGIPLAKAQRR